MWVAPVKKGTTSKIVEFELRDATTGQLMSGRTFADLSCTSKREGTAGTGANDVDVALVAMVEGTWLATNGAPPIVAPTAGIVETGNPGIYQFSVVNASVAAGTGNMATYTFSGAGVLDQVVRIPLELTALEQGDTDTIQAGSDAALRALKLNFLLLEPLTSPADPAVDGISRQSMMGVTLDDGSGSLGVWSYTRTTQSLEGSRKADASEHSGIVSLLTVIGGPAPTVGEIADAVWDEILSGHVTAGSAGAVLGSLLNATFGLSALNDDLDSILAYLNANLDEPITTAESNIIAAINSATPSTSQRAT